MTLKEKVDKLWVARGRSQASLATLIGVSPQRMSLWMNGTGAPKPEQLLRMARAIGVSVDYLADDAAEAPPPPAITDDERYLIQLIRDLNVSRKDAARALTDAAKTSAYRPNEAVGGKIGPPPGPDKTRRRG
jgi:transcriptional regulator with XRE-family HTH domain